MKQSMKRCLAMVLSLALTLTMIPSQMAGTVYAEGTSGTTKTAFDTMVENFTVEGLPSVVTEDGNLTLPSTVKDQAGTTVTWNSSNPAVIKIVTPDDASGNKPYTGEVTRSDVTSKVKLTATIKQNTQTGTKDFDVVVRMKTPVSDSAIAAYDFADFAVKAGSSDILTDEAVNTDARELKLESAGTGKKPTLVNDNKRGQVLSLTQQTYANRGYALLPANPF